MLYGTVLAGTGLAATLGINLAILALEAKPSGMDVVHQSRRGCTWSSAGGGKLPGEAVRDRFFQIGRRPSSADRGDPDGVHQIAVDRPNNDVLLEPSADARAASAVVLHTAIRAISPTIRRLRPAAGRS